MKDLQQGCEKRVGEVKMKLWQRVEGAGKLSLKRIRSGFNARSIISLNFILTKKKRKMKSIK